VQRTDDSPWVFHRRGQPILRFYKAWKKACALAGCPGALFHDFRRTAARNFRRAGLEESEAMKITGHKTAEVFRRYSIVNEPDLRDAVWRAQAYIAGSVPKVCQSQPTASQPTTRETCQLSEGKLR